MLTFSGLHFFILQVPYEFSTGACPTPSGLEFVKTHHCAVCTWIGHKIAIMIVILQLQVSSHYFEPTFIIFVLICRTLLDQPK